MNLSCDICSATRSSETFFCEQCGWDDAEDAVKKKHFQQIVSQYQSIEVQKSVYEQRLEQAKIEIQTIKKEIQSHEVDNAALEAELSALRLLWQKQEEQQLELAALNEAMIPFNFLLNVLKGDPYGGRFLKISPLTRPPHAFSIETNMVAKPNLLLVLSDKKSFATQDARYFLTLESVTELKNKVWEVRIPRYDFIKGDFWGFFTNFHTATIARIEAKHYEFKF